MRNENLLKVTDKKQLKNGNLYMENELNLTIYKKTNINRSMRNNKIKKIMATTNWTIVMRDKKTEKTLLHNLEQKWTYKTAIGIAKESLIDEAHELICIVETNKIMIKNDKEEEEKKSNI